MEMLLLFSVGSDRKRYPGTVTVPGYGHSVTENSADAAKQPLK